MSDSKKRSSADTARRIWLAGIGAYGRAFTEAQEAIKDVTGKGSDVFDELVRKGEILEFVGKEKGKDVLGKTPIPELDLDARIKAMRARLSGTRLSADPDDAVTNPEMDIKARLSAIETKLDTILIALNVDIESKPNSKKPNSKKPIGKASKKRAKTQRSKKPATPNNSAKEDKS